MTRLHTINYFRLRYRVIIKDTLITIALILFGAAIMYGFYAFGAYMVDKLHENKTLTADNAQAMAMMSGERYVVDGAEYRLEEVKQKQLIRGL